MKNASHINIKPALLLTAVLSAILTAGTAAWTKRIPLDQVKVSTPVYTPDFSEFAPKMGKYTYEVSWNGIPAGSIKLELDRKGADYEIRASARTAWYIDIFYQLRYWTEAVISAKTLRPKHSISLSRENSRRKETEVTFLPDGTIHAVRKDHKGRVKSLDFESDNFTLDPYSAAFLALSLHWDVGDKRQFDTFNGKNRYLIELTAVERTRIDTGGGPREAIVIVPTVKKLTDTDSKKKLKGARVYISTGADREILKISSDLFIGSVDTDMVEFSPPGRHDLTRMSINSEAVPADPGRDLPPPAVIVDHRYGFPLVRAAAYR